MTTPATLNILIGDDHRIVREGLTAACLPVRVGTVYPQIDNVNLTVSSGCHALSASLACMEKVLAKAASKR